MDDNERMAIAAMRREVRGEAPRPPDIDSRGEARGSAVALGMGAVFVALVVAYGLANPCTLFKLRMAVNAPADHKAAIGATVCTQTPQGCECRTQREECPHGWMCTVRERDQTAECHFMVSSCVTF